MRSLGPVLVAQACLALAAVTDEIAIEAASRALLPRPPREV
ncbi:MAG: hypothetical protein ACREVO_01940 [Steroidobacteraceae bacterium]